MTVEIRTLRQAQEHVRRQWPGNCASHAAWLAYHQQASDLYRRVAEIDPDHHHEALFWAQQEKEAAGLLVEQNKDSADES